MESVKHRELEISVWCHSSSGLLVIMKWALCHVVQALEQVVNLLPLLLSLAGVDVVESSPLDADGWLGRVEQDAFQ